MMTMRVFEGSLAILFVGIAGFSLMTVIASPTIRQSFADESPHAAKSDNEPPATPAEARVRARLLHEAIGGALQVMHRDFFDDENPPAIPSSSLEDVFAELERSHQVRLKWLTVETDVLNVDHKPQNDFEQQAVAALAAGDEEFSSSDSRTFRFAGPIRLSSQCLKCHVKNRTSTQARKAGLVISIPLETPRDMP